MQKKCLEFLRHSRVYDLQDMEKKIIQQCNAYLCLAKKRRRRERKRRKKKSISIELRHPRAVPRKNIEEEKNSSVVVLNERMKDRKKKNKKKEIASI